MAVCPFSEDLEVMVGAVSQAGRVEAKPPISEQVVFTCQNAVGASGRLAHSVREPGVHVFDDRSPA